MWDCSMGGPRAWKEAQDKQKEFQNSWNQEEPPKNNDDDDDDDDDDGRERMDVEKRDLYAEYSIDPETENEKAQRENGVGDTGEMPGQEDVSSFAITLDSFGCMLTLVGIYNGDDASDTEC